MPYYPEPNILFIHIPKTGGTSLNNYFIKKYNINTNKYTNAIGLYYLRGPKRLSIQHMLLSELFNCKYLSFNKKNLKIITIVRNPYTRLLSELFYGNHITLKSTKEDIYNKILYLFNECEKDNQIFDNHIRPQNEFIDDTEHSVIILKLENLVNDLQKKLDINNFDIHCNSNNVDYVISDYFNENSINLINKFYEKDFIIFEYDFKIY